MFANVPAWSTVSEILALSKVSGAIRPTVDLMLCQYQVPGTNFGTYDCSVMPHAHQLCLHWLWQLGLLHATIMQKCTAQLSLGPYIHYAVYAPWYLVPGAIQ